MTPALRPLTADAIRAMALIAVCGKGCVFTETVEPVRRRDESLGILDPEGVGRVWNTITGMVYTMKFWAHFGIADEYKALLSSRYDLSRCRVDLIDASPLAGGKVESVVEVYIPEFHRSVTPPLRTFRYERRRRPGKGPGSGEWREITEVQATRALLRSTHQYWDIQRMRRRGDVLSTHHNDYRAIPIDA